MLALGSACFDDNGRGEDGDAHDGDSDHADHAQDDAWIFRFLMSMMLIMKKESEVMI